MKLTAKEEMAGLAESFGFDTIIIRHRIESDDLCLDPGNETDEVSSFNRDLLRFVAADVIGCRSNEGEDGDDEDVRKEVVLGSIRATLGFFDHGGDVEDAADATEGDLRTAMGILQRVHEGDDTFGSVGMYVASVDFRSEYRGRGLASYAMLRFLDWHYASSDIFAVVTFPKTTLKEPGAQEKLVAWATRIGYTKYGPRDRNWMIRYERDDTSWWYGAALSRRRKAKGKVSVTSATAGEENHEP